MSRNIITYNLNSELATVNGVHLDKEQSIEITKIIEEKNHCIAELEQEIAELEKEKQTAVKEFAEELYKGLNDLTKHGYTDDQWENICISKYDVEDKIIQLLKERGIE